VKVIVFGASGMIGQGVLRECLRSPKVERVLAVGRAVLGIRDAKLHEVVHSDFTDLSTIENQLTGYDACFFCLGVSAAGMSEADYTRVTYDFTLAAAQALVRTTPQMTFLYISGASTDSTEKGRAMWARVKGKTENALLKLPFRAAYMFRPGYIQPLHGIKSRTGLYRAVYAVASPLYPLVKAISPNSVTTTEDLAKAMIRVAQVGAKAPIVEMRDINALAAEAT
jgi:uncharacterized protein YbjT (DUF2867 family)